MWSVNLKFHIAFLDTQPTVAQFRPWLSSDLDQVHIILNVVGSPSQADLGSVTSEQVGVWTHCNDACRPHLQI